MFIDEVMRRSAGIYLHALREGRRLAWWGANFTLEQMQRLLGSSDEPNLEMNDATLKAEVETELFRPADTPKGRVTIRVVDGVVELRGTAKTQKQIRDLERRAREIPEVRDVENLLHQPETPAPGRTDAPAPKRKRTASSSRGHGAVLADPARALGSAPRQPSKVGRQSAPRKRDRPLPASDPPAARADRPTHGTPEHPSPSTSERPAPSTSDRPTPGTPERPSPSAGARPRPPAWASDPRPARPSDPAPAPANDPPPARATNRRLAHLSDPAPARGATRPQHQRTSRPQHGRATQPQHQRPTHARHARATRLAPGRDPPPARPSDPGPAPGRPAPSTPERPSPSAGARPAPTTGERPTPGTGERATASASVRLRNVRRAGNRAVGCDPSADKGRARRLGASGRFGRSREQRRDLQTARPPRDGGGGRPAHSVSHQPGLTPVHRQLGADPGRRARGRAGSAAEGAASAATSAAGELTRGAALETAAHIGVVGRPFGAGAVANPRPDAPCRTTGARLVERISQLGIRALARLQQTRCASSLPLRAVSQ